MFSGREADCSEMEKPGATVVFAEGPLGGGAMRLRGTEGEWNGWAMTWGVGDRGIGEQRGEGEGRQWK